MRGQRAVLICGVLMLGAAQAAAQPYYGTDRGSRRLIQRFIEDAVIIPGGWIEGQFYYQNLPGDRDRFYAGPLIAFRPANDIEAGLRFGFISLDNDQGPDGSGISDIDLYAKYRLPGGGESRVAVGALLKLPTADEEDFLGTGEIDVELFAAWRADLEAVTLTANAGFRFNGDTDPPLPATDDSVLLGAGILLPATENLTVVIEGSFESERLDGAENDARLTLGVQTLGRGGRGGFRGALALPFGDGAPDYELLFGAVFTY